MTKNQIQNLNVHTTSFSSIKSFNWNLRTSEFEISIDFGNLKCIQTLEDSVLHIQYTDGEIRLDLCKKDLIRILEQ